MKILNASQLQEADRITLATQHISSNQLMERAAGKVFERIHSCWQRCGKDIHIFCGTGNNGGDGLVIARLLLQKGYHVRVYVVNYSEKRSRDFLINQERLEKLSQELPVLIGDQRNFPEIQAQELVIDAVFGTGLSRAVTGWMGELFQHIGRSGARVVAVDMPSGLFADKVPPKEAAVLKADLTLSFQSPKLSFFLPQTMDLVGSFEVLDIGLDEAFLEKVSARACFLEKQEVKGWYIPRKKNSHKGDYGHLLVVGGSHGKIGSILLTASAGLHTGVGLCTIFAPGCGYQILQTGLPEAMVLSDQDPDHLTEISTSFEPNCICFGMGAGTAEPTKAAFESLLEKTNKPMLIDADGLNLLAKNPTLLNLLPEGSILTPHPKELQRLIGSWSNDLEKLEKVQRFVQEYQVLVVLKGAYTFCFFQGEILINSTGNPGMATAGAGDVLSGVIAALLAQGYPSREAAVLGVYLHGLAGDLAAEKMAFEGVIAGGIIEQIGPAFLKLLGN